MPNTRFPCVTVCSNLPEAASHTWATPAVAVAMRLPSELEAILKIGLPGERSPFRMDIRWADSPSQDSPGFTLLHTAMVPLRQPMAKLLLSFCLLKAMAETLMSETLGSFVSQGLNVPKTSPSLASQIFTVPSELPVAKNFASSL